MTPTKLHHQNNYFDNYMGSSLQSGEGFLFLIVNLEAVAPHGSEFGDL